MRTFRGAFLGDLGFRQKRNMGMDELNKEIKKAIVKELRY
jgi:hypothetical protein